VHILLQHGLVLVVALVVAVVMVSMSRGVMPWKSFFDYLPKFAVHGRRSIVVLICCGEGLVYKS
jgi:hypothetical protein